MPLRAGRFVRFGASGGAKFPKLGDSLPRTQMNHRAKFDAASFILAGEIRNRTNKQTHTQTNSKRYIDTLPIDTCVYIKRIGELACEMMNRNMIE